MKSLTLTTGLNEHFALWQIGGHFENGDW
jgi:hypothetical protein